MYTLVIVLTRRCNFNCKWCCFPASEAKDLSYEDAVYAIDKFKPRYLGLTGGEPLMHAELIRIIDYAKSKKSRVVLATNGSLITEDIAKRLNADEINISFDGLREFNDEIRGEGAFDRALCGVDNLIKAGKAKNIVISTVLAKNNVGQVKELIEFFYPRVKRFIIGRVLPIGKGAQYKDNCLSLSEAIKVWGSLLSRKLDPRIRLDFAMQFWQQRSSRFMGPVLLPDGKIGHCCVRYNEIIGDLKNNPPKHSTNCLLCKGCAPYLRKSSP